MDLSYFYASFPKNHKTPNLFLSGVLVFSSWYPSIEVNGKYPNIYTCHKSPIKSTPFFSGRIT